MKKDVVYPPSYDPISRPAACAEFFVVLDSDNIVKSLDLVYSKNFFLSSKVILWKSCTGHKLQLVFREGTSIYRLENVYIKRSKGNNNCLKLTCKSRSFDVKFMTERACNVFCSTVISSKKHQKNGEEFTFDLFSQQLVDLEKSFDLSVVLQNLMEKVYLKHFKNMEFHTFVENIKFMETNSVRVWEKSHCKLWMKLTISFKVMVRKNEKTILDRWLELEDLEESQKSINTFLSSLNTTEQPFTTLFQSLFSFDMKRWYKKNVPTSPNMTFSGPVGRNIGKSSLQNIFDFEFRKKKYCLTGSDLVRKIVSEMCLFMEFGEIERFAKYRKRILGNDVTMINPSDYFDVDPSRSFHPKYSFFFRKLISGGLNPGLLNCSGSDDNRGEYDHVELIETFSFHCDVKACTLNLLCFLLHRKSLVSHLTELAWEFSKRDRFFQETREFGPNQRTWEEEVLRKFNDEFGIEWEDVSFGAFVKKKAEHEISNLGDRKFWPYVDASLIHSACRTIFNTRDSRKKAIEKYLFNCLKGFCDPKNIFEFSVKKVYSTQNKAIEESRLGFWFLDTFGLGSVPHGICHTYILIGNLALHWVVGSHVRVSSLDYRDGFSEIIACDCEPPIVFTVSNVLEKLSKVAAIIVESNISMNYSQANILGSDGDMNCQIFAERIVKALGVERFDPVVDKYFELFKDTLKRKDKQRSPIESVRFLLIDKRILELSIKPRTNRNCSIEDILINHVSEIQIVDVEDQVTERPHYKKVYFQNHSQLDRIGNCFKNEINDFEAKFPGLCSMVKAFDRGFWIGFSKILTREVFERDWWNREDIRRSENSVIKECMPEILERENVITVSCPFYSTIFGQRGDGN